MIRFGGGLAVLVLAISGAGCGQLEVRGADDPCGQEPSLSRDDIESCFQDQTTVLEADRGGGDPTAGGYLRGEALPIAGRRLRQAVALDYSGSMYGGYERTEPGTPPCGWRMDGGSRKPNGPFYWQRRELAELLSGGPLAELTGDEKVHPMTFNARIAVHGEGGPSVFDPAAKRFSTPIPEPVRGRAAVLRQLTATGGGQLPPDPRTAGAFSDASATHLNEVLDAGAALFESFQERDGILWIVTDNIIERAPRDGSETYRDVRNNRRFYETLKQDPRWQVVYAWPIHRADWLCGSTLMVYGFYYSSRERINEPTYEALTQGPEAQLGSRRQLEALRRYGDAGSPSPGEPFKLKPVDMDIVRLSFKGQVFCRPVPVGVQAECRALLQIENLLNHRTVEQAHFVLRNGRCDPLALSGRQLRRVRTAAPLCSDKVEQTLDLESSLAPGESDTIEITFRAPAVHTVRRTLADYWENANYERFQMIGGMSVGIRDLRTEMVIEERELGSVYGVEALPELFRNPRTENLATSICLVLSVKNPTHFASVVLISVVALAALAALAGAWLIRPSYRRIVVDGEDAGRIRLSRISSVPLELDGRRVGKARLGLNGTPSVRGLAGHVIRKRGAIWEYTGDGFDPARRIALRHHGKATPRRDDGF